MRDRAERGLRGVLREAAALASPDTAGADAANRLVIRDGTPEDVERIKTLTEDDFAADLGSVQIPNREGPMSDGEMKVAVDSLLDSLKRERGGDRGR